MGWVVRAVGIEEVQKGYISIYFNGKRYFGNSRRKLKKNVKVNMDQSRVFFSGLDLFFSCSEKCRAVVVEN
jgi:hypothetical protein